MAGSSLSVIIADDHPAILIATRQVLKDVSGWVIAGAATSASELLDLLSKLHCDVLISDYSMPGDEQSDGVALLGHVQRHYPLIRIVVLTMLTNANVVRCLLRIGVRCIVSKSDDFSHLMAAVQATSAGRDYFSPSVTVVVKLLEGRERGAPHIRKLTGRELEVVRLYSSGLTINEIADQLKRTKQTVSNQKSNAMRKLGIESDADLIRYTIEEGLIPPS